MQDNLSIRGIITIIAGVIISLWLGFAIVTEQLETLLKVGAISLLLICAMSGRRIWLVMLVFGALNIPIIRGYTTAELGQTLFVCFGCLLILMRRFHGKFCWGELEWWRIILGACILQVYLRNPVGLGLFGTGSVGGKPYMLASLAFVVSWMYGSMIVPSREIKWAMYIALVVAFIGIPIAELRTRAGLAQLEASQNGGPDSAANEGNATRIGFLGGFASNLSRWIASRVNPLKACFNPLWAPLILITIVAAAGSGYRNTIAIVGLTYLISLAYHGGLFSVIFASFMGIMGIASLSIVNLLTPLPPNVQRALTIFPGTWEQRYVDDAKDSSEWRYEMWREALFTDRWIQNKWIGDGLGQSAADLARAATLASAQGGGGRSGLTIHQENAMLSGDYHSGPVQTIRTVGYLGLAVMVAFMFRTAVHAHRQIIRCRGTEWFPVALFFFTSTMSSPLMFLFVVGDFTRATVGLFVGSAFIRLFQNSIPLPPYVKPTRTPYMLHSQRFKNRVRVDA